MAVQSSGWGCSGIHDHFGADPVSSQNPANCGAPDLQPAGDFGFADAGAMQFSDFRGMHCRSCRPTQPFPVLPRMGQPDPRSLSQNLSFELGETSEA
jgi:hypothetical protein